MNRLVYYGIINSGSKVKLNSIKYIQLSLHTCINGATQTGYIDGKA